ncbi:hypothetical protein [Blastococcus sp. SYSU DS0539]
MRGTSDAAARAAVDAAAAGTGLVADDVVRFGADRVLTPSSAPFRGEPAAE